MVSKQAICIKNYNCHSCARAKQAWPPCPAKAQLEAAHIAAEQAHLGHYDQETYSLTKGGN